MPYYADKEVKVWAEQTLKRSAALQDLKEIEKASKSCIVHDVWSAYAYGNTVKFIYTKKRFTPPKKKSNAIVPAESPLDDEKIIELRKACGTFDPEVSTHSVNNSVDKERFFSSVSRAKARVFELAACNEFQFFGTLTLNQEWWDRENLKDFRKSFAMLVRNLNRDRTEKIKYILLPERHKKGGWHLHGLFKGLTDDDLRAFTLKDKIPKKMKKQLKKGEKLFDFTRYSQKFGFSSFSPIKSKDAAAVYITKYITKDIAAQNRSCGEHLFFASQGLKGREVLALDCTEPPPYDEWDFENDYFKIKTVSLSEISDS